LAGSLLISGCSIYRHDDYILRFSKQSGSPPEERQLEVRLLHEVFPLNAPRPIYTNLDEHGMVALRLPNHFPTGFFLRHTNSSPFSYWFRVDLHSFRQDAATNLSTADFLGGEYRLDITKSHQLK
jgi:hypothetical protein